MKYIQFRIHPSVGIARMGGSTQAYYVASEFPHFLKEQHSELRHKVKPRKMPPVAPSTSYKIYNFDRGSNIHPDSLEANVEAVPTATYDHYKDKSGNILPQAAQFRIFAYVYTKKHSRWPEKTFEITADMADIDWTVKLANLKSQDSSDKILKRISDEVQIKTSSPIYRKIDVNPNTTLLPNSLSNAQKLNASISLASLFLEREDDAPANVTGRLHVIGGSGEVKSITGSTSTKTGMWSVNVFDGAADGPVKANIKIKNDGQALRAAIKATPTSPSISANEVEYLNHETGSPVSPGNSSTISALSAWVVVGLPNYNPDMGHFISLWDVAFNQGKQYIDGRKSISSTTTQHKKMKSVNAHTTAMDYKIHIHPQLCRFGDVIWVSNLVKPKSKSPGSVAKVGHPSSPEDTMTASGINSALSAVLNSLSNPSINLTTSTMSTYYKSVVENYKLKSGGFRIQPRHIDEEVLLSGDAALKGDTPLDPIHSWLKRALFLRLRNPSNLYSNKRYFYEGNSKNKKFFPRNLGRRYSYRPNKNISSKFVDMPASYGETDNSTYDYLRDYPNQIKRSSGVCGKLKREAKLKNNTTITDSDKIDKVDYFDDLYWPASYANMPMLYDHAFTNIQYAHFDTWQATDGGKTPLREISIYSQIINSQRENELKIEKKLSDHEAYLGVNSARFMPSLIDQAYLESMLGGSFLPGIEVGLEGAKQENWTLYHGANAYFPDIRFEDATLSHSHYPGILTKDLACPWQNDFFACDDQFWPTARPIKTTRIVSSSGTQSYSDWMSISTPNSVAKVNAYWQNLGFIRREDTVHNKPNGEIDHVDAQYLEKERTP